MSDFLFPLSDGVPETAENAERLEHNAADQVKGAMLEISSTTELKEDEASWLESLLEREREGVRHCFIGTHANFFSPAGYVDVISTYPVDEWMRLLDLFERHRVTAVFSGHSHMRDETTLGGVRYVTVGSWCDDKREWAWVECRTDSSLQIDFRSVD